MCGKSEWCCIHTHMHTHTYIQRTSRVATSVLSGRLVLAKVQADQKKRIITGSEYSSPPPSQTRFCRKATPLACKRNTLDKKTSLNISFGTRGSIIFLCRILHFSANFRWIVFPDFAPNSRKEWRLSIFNQICENKFENCRNFGNLWKLIWIIQYYSIQYYSIVSLLRSGFRQCGTQAGEPPSAWATVRHA